MDENGMMDGLMIGRISPSYSERHLDGGNRREISANFTRQPINTQKRPKIGDDSREIPFRTACPEKLTPPSPAPPTTPSSTPIEN
jgi:hypothetical protein